MTVSTGSIIDHVGRLLAAAKPGVGNLALHDAAGAIRATVSPGIDMLSFEGTSRFGSLAGQFSGTIRAAAPGVRRFCLEYSDAECCGSTMSFTVEDGTGRILSIEPADIDRSDTIVLPAQPDPEARQAIDDRDYLELAQVGP